MLCTFRSCEALDIHAWSFGIMPLDIDVYSPLLLDRENRNRHSRTSLSLHASAALTPLVLHTTCCSSSSRAKGRSDGAPKQFWLLATFYGVGIVTEK